MSNRRLLVLITVLIMAMVMVFSLTWGATAKVSISIWYGMGVEPGTDSFVESINDFMHLNPDIEVEMVNQAGYGETRDKALVAYAGGAAPNVALFALVNTLQFVDVGALLPLDEYLVRDGLLKDIFPQMLQASTYGGKVYGLPYRSSTAVLYINENMFGERGLAPKPPTTWKELEQAATRITRDRDGDGKTDVFGISFPYDWNFLFDQWVFQNGGTILNPQGSQFVFNSPAAVDAMQFLQRLVHEKGVATTGTNSQGNKKFLAADTGMKDASTAQLGEWIQLAPFGLGVGPLTCNVKCWSSISGANLTMMNTGTPEQKDAAWKLMKHIFSTTNLAKYAIASGYMASRRSSFNSDVLQKQFANDPRYRVSYMQVDSSAPRDGTHVPFWSQVQSEIQKVGAAMFRENGNVKAALDTAVDVSNAMLKEYFTKSGRKSLYDR